MKKILVLLLLLSCCGTLRAHGTERIRVATDRSVYIAGDEVWCSLFCLDAQKGQFSDFSAVAYVELISTDGTAASAKISLLQGRGAGKFRIPVKTPTGNYRLVAYTALNANESGTDWMAGAKTLSVFNTGSTVRVQNGVTAEAPTPVEEAACGKLEIGLAGTVRSGAPFTLLVHNAGDAASLCLSVYHEDGLAAPATPSLQAFADGLPGTKPVYTGKRLPEYEGEILYAAVEGLEESQLDLLSDQAVATLSSAGSPSDVYLGRVQEKGRLVFPTNNIFGDRELVCEVALHNYGGGHISLLDNYLHPDVQDVAPLYLDAGQYAALARRKASLAVSLQADTLLSFLPRRQDFLLESLDKKTYNLNDYTRFPSFQEVIVELIPELRLTTYRGRRSLQMVVMDVSKSRRIVKENLLVMLDGVVISDISLLEGMDAMLLDQVDLYTQNVMLGNLSWDGVVNFNTRKNYVKALRFPDHVRIVDFQGVSYPVAYLGAVDPRTQQDLRQLLYWHPLQSLPAGETLRLPLTAPAYSGRFVLVVEGFTTAAQPIHATYTFDVQ